MLNAREKTTLLLAFVGKDTKETQATKSSDADLNLLRADLTSIVRLTLIVTEIFVAVSYLD